MSTSQDHSDQTSPLDPVALSRRNVVKGALAASAVAVPVISSVVLGGASPAFAESPNISGRTTTAGTTTAGTTTAGTTTTTTASPTTTTTTTTVAPTPPTETTTGTTPEI